MYTALLLMTAGSRAIMLFLMAVVLPHCKGRICGIGFSRIPFRKIPRNRSEVNPAISRNLSFKRKTTTGKKHVYPKEEFFPAFVFQNSKISVLFLSVTKFRVVFVLQ
jgi:hypothetical protein